MTSLPTASGFLSIAKSMGFDMTEADAEDFLVHMKPHFEAADTLLSAPEVMPTIKYPRTPGYRPGPAEDPNNSWYRKTSIKGAPEGKLKGRTAALKDNVFVAGVPMMNGSTFLDGFVPDVDATVVTRLLDAGAEITGKVHCEYFCLSGSSHTNATGACHNPWKRGHSAGGSSSGSAAAVAAGEVDMTIGGDQGGSIRLPASFCGIVGLKPTHGLVPYTGIMSLDMTIDHTGPMTRTVADNALMLEVIAGPDGYDMRQPAYEPPAYSKHLSGGVKGMRIAIVKEGFGRPESEEAVDAKVLAAAELYRKMGAIVTEISLPLHDAAAAFFMPMAAEGFVRQIFDSNGVVTGVDGLYSTAAVDRFRHWKDRANEFPDTAKVFLTLGRAMADMHGGKVWAKAINARRALKAKFAAVMENYDILLMPTTPMVAPALPEPGAPRSVILKKAWEMLGNTAPYNSTGMPSLTVPCGMSNGLPVGLMLTGKWFDEVSLFKAAYAFEQDGDWTKK
ncbi:amidase [Chthonobacter albigriseus]|uniref:amidase n=1 Tax=Chthonobacter albigriseus TaxID=1683161 RepID=UPI0015EEF991|nr:amidase [Chthonobacter albigriseus]